MATITWNYKKLSEVTSLIKDGTHGTHKDVIGGVPLLIAKDIYDGSVHFGNNPRCISEDDFSYIHKNYQLRLNDILLTVVGTIGRAAIIKDLSRKFTIQRSVALIRLDNSVLSEYCYQYFTFDKFQDSLTAGSQGLAQAGVYLAELGKKIIPVPPVNTQFKISSILSSVDEAIQKTDQIIKKTDRLKNGMMKYIFEIESVKENWSKKTLSNVADVQRGRFSIRPRNDPKYYGGNTPFIQTGDVVGCNGIIKKFSQTLNDDGLKVSRLFKKGTIVMTIAANIGDTGILSFDSCFPDSLVGIIPHDDIDVLFLEYYLRSKKDYLNGISTQSAQKNINLAKLNPMIVLVPSLERQRQISSTLNYLDKKIDLEMKYKKDLFKLKDGLMSDIFSQKVEVN